MSLWQKRAALPKLLAHSAHRRHTKPQELRNLPGALAPFIKLQNALAHRNRYGSHEHTLPYAFLFIKLYYLWKCSKQICARGSSARGELQSCNPSTIIAIVLVSLPNPGNRCLKERTIGGQPLLPPPE